MVEHHTHFVACEQHSGTTKLIPKAGGKDNPRSINRSVGDVSRVYNQFISRNNLANRLTIAVKELNARETQAAISKPIGAICHAPWLLVEADLLDGRSATSWPSIRTDLRNAGARVVDEPAVTDGNIVTSRNPDDVEAFTNALIDLVEQAPEVTEVERAVPA